MLSVFKICHLLFAIIQSNDIDMAFLSCILTPWETFSCKQVLSWLYYTVRSQLDTVTLKALVKSVMAQHWLWLHFLILSYKDCNIGSDQIRRWPPPYVSRALDWIRFTRERCEVMRSSCRIMGLGLIVGSFWGQKCLICDAVCICKMTEKFII